MLAHLDCDDKSNEIPAVQTLLGALGLAGAVVTVDAIARPTEPVDYIAWPLPVLLGIDGMSFAAQRGHGVIERGLGAARTLSPFGTKICWMGT